MITSIYAAYRGLRIVRREESALIETANKAVFTIMGNPATKKNSPIVVRGRAAVLPSKAYRRYEQEFRRQLSVMKEQNGLSHFSVPVHLKAEYYLENRAHYPDLSGLIQATQDILSDEFGTVLDRETGKRKRQKRRRCVLEDDRIVKSLDGCRIAGIDKTNPRVEITIEAMELNLETETDPYLIRLAKSWMAQGLFSAKREGDSLD